MYRFIVTDFFKKQLKRLVKKENLSLKELNESLEKNKRRIDKTSVVDFK